MTPFVWDGSRSSVRALAVEDVRVDAVYILPAGTDWLYRTRSTPRPALIRSPLEQDAATTAVPIFGGSAPESFSDVAVSHDGTRLAMALRLEGRAHVAVLEIGSSSLRVLAPGHHPVWSPDDAALAFETDMAGVPGTGTHVAVARADGSNVRLLIDGTAPQWSPRGDALVVRRAANAVEPWVRFDFFGLDVCLGTQEQCAHVNRLVAVPLAEGAPPIALTPPDADDAEAVWLPSGDAVVFTSDRPDTSSEGASHRHLWTVRRDGTGLRVLTSGSHDEDLPAVGGDGTVFFRSDARGPGGLWRLRIPDPGAPAPAVTVPALSITAPVGAAPSTNPGR